MQRRYIRATLLGFWVDAPGDVVWPWFDALAMRPEYASAAGRCVEWLAKLDKLLHGSLNAEMPKRRLLGLSGPRSSLGCRLCQLLIDRLRSCVIRASRNLFSSDRAVLTENLFNEKDYSHSLDRGYSGLPGGIGAYCHHPALFD